MVAVFFTRRLCQLTVKIASCNHSQSFWSVIIQKTVGGNPYLNLMVIDEDRGQPRKSEIRVQKSETQRKRVLAHRTNRVKLRKETNPVMLEAKIIFLIIVTGFFGAGPVSLDIQK